MNWQRIGFILLLISSFNSYSGGVDVGNGGLTMGYEIVIDQNFTSEQALTNYLDNAKHRIESGEEFNLDILRRQHQCHRKIQMKQMSVEEFYPVKDGFILPKQYKGLLKINLINCKGIK